MVEGFRQRGWALFPPESSVVDWVAVARECAMTAVRDPALAHWHQCGGTWFVGIDALANDAVGALPGAGPLGGAALDMARRVCGRAHDLHRAQLSVVYPGYPRPRDGESGAAFRYRRDRDAAHVDGVLALGPARRRFVQEPHAFILGIQLSVADSGASPLVVWEGSHHVMRRTFQSVLGATDPDTLQDVDVTDAYVEARREVFRTCSRVELSGSPGSAVLLHRMALHGVAPWAEGARAAPEGRMVAYFRPLLPGGVGEWLSAP